MFRRRILYLLLTLAATQLFLSPTAWGALTPDSASAATSWAAGATEESTIHPAAPLAALQASADALSSSGDDYTTHSLSAQEEMLLNLLNQDRISAGLPPLVHDPALSRIARMKSQDMRDGNYFAHESPTWGKAREMLTRLGYNFRACGENIAHHATIPKAQAAFMTSPGHRRNILSPNWQRVGVGVSFDRNGFILATQLFVR